MHKSTLDLERFTETGWLVLLSLASGAKNAAQLQEVIAHEYGLFLEPGTLYRTIARLEHLGWLSGLKAENHLCLYRLTVSGELALQRERARNYERHSRINMVSRFELLEEHIVRIAFLLLRLYPRAWRERYEEEMKALLELHEISLFTYFDLLLGAIDARLDPHYRLPRAITAAERIVRFRTAASIAFCAFSFIVLFYSLFILDQVDGPWDALRNTNALVTWAYTIADLGIGVAWLAIMCAGIFNALNKAGQKMTIAKNVSRFLPLICALCPPALLLFHALLPIPINVLDSVGFVVVWLSFLFAPVVVALAVNKRKTDEQMSRLFLVTGAIATLGQAIFIVGLIICQWVASQQWPDGNWSVQLILGLVLMVLPAVAALWMLVRGIIAAMVGGPSSPQALVQHQEQHS